MPYSARLLRSALASPFALEPLCLGPAGLAVALVTPGLAHPVAHQRAALATRGAVVPCGGRALSGRHHRRPARLPGLVASVSPLSAPDRHGHVVISPRRNVKPCFTPAIRLGVSCVHES